MNECKFIGRLAQDPEVRYTKAGRAVASFSIAVNRESVKEGGSSLADFIPVVVWGTLAESCGNTLSKGNQIFASGRLQVRSYETTDGQKRRVTELVASFISTNILSDKKQNKQDKPPTADFSSFGKDVTDEEVPF